MITCKNLFLLILISGCTVLHAQHPTASEILLKCINAHDPLDKWGKFNGDFEQKIERTGVATRHFVVKIDNRKNGFAYSVNNDTVNFEQGIIKGKYFSQLRGNDNISDSDRKKYQLTNERTLNLKEVYDYLVGIPMRLNRDQNMLDMRVTDTIFNQKSCYKITFNYLPKIDNETWHFFIDRQTFLMAGYQFYHDDIGKDGEFIYLSDFVQCQDIQFPSIRKWHWNKDGSYFRTDFIMHCK